MKLSDSGLMEQRLMDLLQSMPQVQIFEQLFTHPVSGLWNREAMKNVDQYTHVAMIDMDSLKYYNDNFGHDVGDRLIRGLGIYLCDIFGRDRVFHLSGDEFVVFRFDSTDCVVHVIDYVKDLDQAYTFTKIPFSYGVGSTLKEADNDMRVNKAQRQAKGERGLRDQCPPKFDITILEDV